jgi:hypothetical protein
MLGTLRKRPDDILDYDVSFEKWLSSGDSLIDATATADSVNLTVLSVSLSGAVAKVWLSAGLDGESYTVTVTATTAQGRVKEVAFNLRLVEC